LRRIHLLMGALAVTLSASAAFAQAPYAAYGYLQPNTGYQGHWQYAPMQASAPVSSPSSTPAVVTPASAVAPVAVPYAVEVKPAYGAMVVNHHQAPCCDTQACAPQGCCPEITPICPTPCYDQPCGQLPCEPMCAEPCKKKHCCIVGGGGAYYLRPYWENNPAFGALLGQAFATEEDFDFQYDFAYGAWAGIVKECGLGVRGRAFYFRQDAETATALDRADDFTLVTATPLGLGIFTQGGGGGDPGETLTINSELFIQYFDLEVTQQFQLGSWWLLLAGGARYAEIAQNYNVDFDDFIDDVQVASLRSGHNFRGYGPTVAVEARKPFCCGLTLFGSARGSILIGDRTENSFLRSTDFDNDADTDFFGRTREGRSTMPIAELEVGVEYNKWIKGARLFVQAAVVSHTYFGAGNASNTSTTLEADLNDVDNDSYFANGRGIDDRANLTLFGGKLVVGVNY
jgi:hypothetical protein